MADFEGVSDSDRDCIFKIFICLRIHYNNGFFIF